MKTEDEEMPVPIEIAVHPSTKDRLPCSKVLEVEKVVLSTATVQNELKTSLLYQVQIPHAALWICNL